MHFVSLNLPFQRTNQDNELDEHCLVSIVIRWKLTFCKREQWPAHGSSCRREHYIEVPRPLKKCEIV